LFQNRLFSHRLLQFFGLEPAKLRIFKEAVPKTEVLEQPKVSKQFFMSDTHIILKRFNRVKPGQR
ncbi:MAG: hypothetical protein LBD48_14660, partial [Treponema sp.]|nr:hypothetical protein [Treponema sp.]